MAEVPELTKQDAEQRLVTDDEQAHAADNHGQQKAPEIIEAVTAFVVYFTPQGDWQVTGDLNAPIVPLRQPSRDEVRGGCAVVQQDFGTQDTAALTSDMTIQKMVMMQRQIAEQRQAQDILNATKGGTGVPPAFQRGQR